MTPDLAQDLAIRYKNIWRGGPATEELRTQLIAMDLEPAYDAITDLARTSEHPPSIHTLWTAYRAHLPLPASPTANETGPPTSLDETIQRLEWKAGTGTATHGELIDLDNLRNIRRQSVERHPSRQVITPADHADAQ